MLAARHGRYPPRPRHESVLRRRRRRRRRQPRDPRRRVHRPRRPVGLRQIDAAAHDRRPRGSDRRHGVDRRTRRHRARARHRDIAMVFQNYALYPHMTVRQNLGYGLKVRRTPKHEIARASTRSPSCSGSTSCSIDGRRSSRVASASASRWAARSCGSHRRSSWTSRCRTSTRSSAWGCAPRWRSSTQRLGVTTVYVTHDQVEAMTLGQRVAVMRDGRILQVDTPQTLYSSRATSSSPRSSARRR